MITKMITNFRSRVGGWGCLRIADEAFRRTSEDYLLYHYITLRWKNSARSGLAGINWFQSWPQQRIPKPKVGGSTPLRAAKNYCGLWFRCFFCGEVVPLSKVDSHLMYLATATQCLWTGSSQYF